jgi:hypothetical protein
LTEVILELNFFARTVPAVNEIERF